MRDSDLTHTVHAAVARLAERLVDRFDTSRGRAKDASASAFKPITPF
jgi:pantothenate kinase